jgi:hypothetical protein
LILSTVPDKSLSTRMVWNIVARWGRWGGVGKLSPHDHGPSSLQAA